MIFKQHYKQLKKSIFLSGDYILVPVRYNDRFPIMKWRNDQIEILRQKELLTEEKQEDYFKNVVAKLFDDDKPSQIIFSLLLKNELIGYGGLVHINWSKQTAEISFLNTTERAANIETFDNDWTNFLTLIEIVAFEELKLHRINTYAYNLRPYLYPILEASGYIRDKNQSNDLPDADKYSDIVIHYKMNSITK